MIIDAHHLLVRAAALYVVVVMTGLAWMWRRPGSRHAAAAALGVAWNLPALLALHLIATRAGWWQFDANGGVLLGIPVDLWLAWAWLWGALPVLAAPSLPVSSLVLAALTFDLLVMPLAAPVVQLGPTWLAGEFAGLTAGLLPSQLLARWTLRDEQLGRRAVLQAIAFGGLVLFVLPAIAIDGSNGQWTSPLDRPRWQVTLALQALAIPAMIGLTAVQEFVERGRGTPVPFDPPRRLVTSGIYSYVRNPMQLSGVLLLGLLGVVLGNLWVAAAGVVAHLYSMGLAGWDEREDLRRRFGDDWTTYEDNVRRWVPRLRPWHPADRTARLYIAQGCGMCRDVGAWLERRAPAGLTIVPAESHPSGSLERITYDPADGTRVAAGVAAFARALEHTHVGWALVGWTLRLPGVLQAAQLLIDASGGEPRPIARTRTRCTPARRRRTSDSRA